jgi:hypothetical protein
MESKGFKSSGSSYDLATVKLCVNLKFEIPFYLSAQLAQRTHHGIGGSSECAVPALTNGGTIKLLIFHRV